MKKWTSLLLSAVMVLAICVSAFTVPASAEATNIAPLATNDAPTGYAQYTANLFDGAALDKMAYTNDWFGYYQNGEGNAANNFTGANPVLNLTFDKLYDISKVKVNVWSGGAGDGIAQNNGILVEYSRDNEHWYTYGKTAKMGVKEVGWQSLELDATAKYVRLTFNKGTGSFFFLNEVEVYGVEHEGEYEEAVELSTPANVLDVSHVNNYSWGAFNCMMITGEGRSCNSVGYACQWWVAIKVDNVDGQLVVTSIEANGANKTNVASADGFIVYVFADDKDYGAAAKIRVGDVCTANFDWSANAASETPVGQLSFSGWTIEAASPMTVSNALWQYTDADHSQPAIDAKYTVSADANNIYIHTTVNRPWEYKDATYQTGATNFRIWMLGSDQYGDEAERTFFDVTLKEDKTLACWYNQGKSVRKLDGSDKISAVADTSAETIDVTFTVVKSAIAATNGLKLMVSYSSPYIGEKNNYNAYQITNVEELPGGWSGNASAYTEYAFAVEDPYEALNVVAGLEVGAWQDGTVQEGLAYAYSMEVRDGNAIFHVIANAKELTGTAASFGNGAGANIRIWTSSLKEGTTTYNHFFDISLRDGLVTSRLLENTNPTGNKAAVVSAYDAASPYGLKYKANKTAMEIVLSVPMEVLGAEDDLQAIYTVSNKLNGVNAALYSSENLAPYSAWNNATSVYSKYAPVPEDAISFTHVGYLHGNAVVILAGDNETVGKLTERGAGAEKDMNYFKVLVVDKYNQVIEVNTTLGRPDGVKTDMVCPEGGYIIGYNANLAGHEAIDAIEVGSYVELYNVDLDEVRAIEGNREAKKAAFRTYKLPVNETVLTEGEHELECGQSYQFIAPGAGKYQFVIMGTGNYKLYNGLGIVSEDDTVEFTAMGEQAYLDLLGVGTVYVSIEFVDGPEDPFIPEAEEELKLGEQTVELGYIYKFTAAKDGKYQFQIMGTGFELLGADGEVLTDAEGNPVEEVELKAGESVSVKLEGKGTASVNVVIEGEPEAGDAGIILFAIIGMIALAGAAVTIKVRA